MKYPIQSMAAGFAGTLVLSMLMAGKSMMGIMPQLDVIAMLSSMMHTTPALGWVAHFAIGTMMWGLGFAVLRDHLPGRSNVTKGIAFGVAAWALMMLFVMPMAGAGIMGLKLGMPAPVMTLMLHVIFGAVLGLVYDRLTRASASTAVAATK